MAVWIDPSKTWDYQLEHERGKPDATTWKLRPLTVGQHAEIQDLPVMDQKAGTFCARTGEAHARVLRYGIAGVTNLGGWSGGIIDDAFIAGLHPAWRTELALAIINRSTLQDSDRKNLSSPPASPAADSSRTVVAAEV